MNKIKIFTKFLLTLVMLFVGMKVADRIYLSPKEVQQYATSIKFQCLADKSNTDYQIAILEEQITELEEKNEYLEGEIDTIKTKLKRELGIYIF